MRYSNAVPIATAGDVAQEDDCVLPSGEGGRQRLGGIAGGLDADRVIEATMVAMSAEAMAGADDLYAESARTFLCVHLLTQHTSLPPSEALPVDDVRVASAVDFMHDHLASPITLDDLAGAAHLSTSTSCESSKPSSVNHHDST